MYGIWLAFAAAGFRICAKGTWPLFILSFHSKNCTLSVTFHNGLSVRYLRIASVNSGIVPLPFSSISGFLHSLIGIIRMCWLVSPSPHSLIRGNLLIIWLPFWYHYLLWGDHFMVIAPCDGVGVDGPPSPPTVGNNAPAPVIDAPEVPPAAPEIPVLTHPLLPDSER